MKTLLFFGIIGALTNANAYAGGTCARQPCIAPAPGYDVRIEEGTETELPQSSLDAISEWATNSAAQLRDLLDAVKSLSDIDKRQMLVRGIESVVRLSSPKQTELLMRFALNRALRINKEITETSALSEVGAVDMQNVILERSIELALKYYKSDLEYLNGQKTHGESSEISLPFVQLAVEYVRLIMELDQSVFGYRAQYNITRMALGFFHVDLHRDKNLRYKFAEAIGKIDRTLKSLPELAPTAPALSIKLRKQMIKTYEQTMPLVLEVMNSNGIRLE